MKATRISFSSGNSILVKEMEIVDHNLTLLNGENIVINLRLIEFSFVVDVIPDKIEVFENEKGGGKISVSKNSEEISINFENDAAIIKNFLHKFSKEILEEAIKTF